MFRVLSAALLTVLLACVACGEGGSSRKSASRAAEADLIYVPYSNSAPPIPSNSTVLLRGTPCAVVPTAAGDKNTIKIVDEIILNMFTNPGGLDWDDFHNRVDNPPTGKTLTFITPSAARGWQTPRAGNRGWAGAPVSATSTRIDWATEDRPVRARARSPRPPITSLLCAGCRSTFPPGHRARRSS